MRRWTGGLVLGLLAAALAAPARADEVWLAGGGRLEGVVVARDERSLTLEIGPGRVSLPARSVTRVVAGTAPLDVYRKRAATLAPGDSEGWLDLARWAHDHGLRTQEREALRRSMGPEAAGRAEARAAEDEAAARKARAEEEALRAHAEMDEAERARVAAAQAEAEFRAREAEARAREAEARARQAEEGPAAPSGGLIPESLIAGGYPGYGGYPAYGVPALTTQPGRPYDPYAAFFPYVFDTGAGTSTGSHGDRPCPRPVSRPGPRPHPAPRPRR